MDDYEVSITQDSNVTIFRLSSGPISMRDWKFSRMMIRAGLQFNEGQLLKILDALGAKGCWKQALSVVEWVYNLKSHSHSKSR